MSRATQQGATLQRPPGFAPDSIPLVDWPLYLPDLNSIEYIWQYLKTLVLKTYTEIENIGTGEEALKALENTLVEAWNDLPDMLFEQCADSTPYRVQAVIDTKGWHTKYQRFHYSGV